MIYNSTVTECLSETVIHFDKPLEDAKINVIRQLCDKNILFVLDNFDVSVEDGNELRSLLNLNCKTIVTTRTDFSEVYNKSKFLTIYGLPVDVLKCIFEKEAGGILYIKKVLLR